MTPYHADDWLTVYHGDCREVMAAMEPESVHCVVTSPPYWGLRDYGEPGQLGLEPTPEAYVANLVAVFREVRRVLRADGTVWLNLGDSYNAYNGGAGPSSALSQTASRERPDLPTGYGLRYKGLKPKDLVGIPWRVAFALQADGWYLRSDIIWSKPNPMPESVTDRPTKSHEMIFLLSKSPRYFFDAEAVREGVGEARVVETANGHDERLVLGQDFGLERATSYSNAVGVRLAASILDRARRQDQLGLSALDPQIWHQGGNDGTGPRTVGDPIMRRAATEASRFADGDVSAKEFLREVDGLCVALPDGHDLKELRARAGLAAPTAVPLIDSDGDAPVAIDDAREVGEFEVVHNKEYTSQPTHSSGLTGGAYSPPGQSPHGNARPSKKRGEFHGKTEAMPGRNAFRAVTTTRNIRSVWTVATAPYPGAHFATFPPKLIEPCIKAGCPEGGTVLDPFAGSGTTGMVAQSLSRRAVLIDLSLDYLGQLMDRNADIPLGLTS